MWRQKENKKISKMQERIKFGEKYITQQWQKNEKPLSDNRTTFPMQGNQDTITEDITATEKIDEKTEK